MSDEHPAQDALDQIQTLLAKTKASQQSNPEFKKFPDNFSDICAEWAQRDIWTLDEATNLLCGTSPNRPFTIDGQEELNHEIKQMHDIISRADVNFQGTLNKKAKATDLVKWGLEKDINIPKALIYALENAEKPITQKTKLRPDQIQRLICQAIARTLWDVDPEMTITAMTRHNAILEYGDAKHYSEKAVRKWVAEVAPETVKNKRGRPKKSTK